MENRIPNIQQAKQPMILAPAGGKDAFLAALAAGADAIYCGLKLFSARMAADNFTVADLARLTSLAHAMGVKVYVAFNTLLKPGEMDTAAGLLEQVSRYVLPDAFIFQDLAFIDLARRIGFEGELHVSTLANVSFPGALHFIRRLRGVTRVVIPRELGIDEIKSMTAACPDGLSLEVFVHGALCYGVSGRCYWSSFLGGRSGLRGRCVQPCRRIYQFGGAAQRYFSCQDFSLDVLAKILLSEEKISAWKIEGRKKGPHYVYAVVRAYRLFRDHSHEPDAKKEALGLLADALGRPGTHYRFLDQRPQVPVRTDIQTGSGRLLGKVQGGTKELYFRPSLELLAGDILRFGYEDEAGHQTLRVKRPIPKKGRLVLGPGSGISLRPGAAVFLIDRRESILTEPLLDLEKQLASIKAPAVASVVHPPAMQRRQKARKAAAWEMTVFRRPGKHQGAGSKGLWLSLDRLPSFSRRDSAALWWWLPPVIWPAKETVLKETLGQLRRMGARRFVLNAPWQAALLENEKSLELWAGPFCNIGNPQAVEQLAGFGFQGVIVSPELSARDYEQMAAGSCLPLGIVLAGNWPLCVSRTIEKEIPMNRLFTSPKGEQAWVREYDGDYWVYPNWRLDISPHRDWLIKAGFQLLVHLAEPEPKGIEMKKRPGLWNWDLELL